MLWNKFSPGNIRLHLVLRVKFSPGTIWSHQELWNNSVRELFDRTMCKHFIPYSMSNGI